jgi:hypothetical protein
MTQASTSQSAKILQFPTRPLAGSRAERLVNAVDADLRPRAPVDIDGWYHKAAVDEEMANARH